MKTHNLFITMIALAATFVSCTVNTESDNTTTEQPEMHMHETSEARDTLGMEYTSAYICPMHCKGSGSAEPGNCPNCGMAYVKNPDHHAESSYACPMHPEEKGAEGDRCGICGMALEDTHIH